jgi:Domain of unknown function (DUF1877)
MSVLGEIRQIPPQVLKVITESRYSSEFSAKIGLYTTTTSEEIKNLDQWEDELRENFYAEEHIQTLKALKFDVVSTVTTIQSLAESYQIPIIDLGKEWMDIMSFLTGKSYPEEVQSYILSEKTVDNISIPLINAVGGKAFEYNTGMYEAFITDSDVKNIAKALTLISEDFTQQWNIRWAHLIEEMGDFDETDEESFYEIFSELLDFYQDAANQNSAVYINIC